MKILTLEHGIYELDQVPDEIDDLRFAVLDNSNPKDPDYYFVPLIFLESFSSPALVLQIGKHQVKMPVDWKIVIGEEEHGDLEVMPLTSINDRDFKAFEFSPLGAYSPTYLPIDLIDVYTEVKWYMPKLKSGQILCVPLTSEENSPCVYFVKEITKTSEVIDINKAW